MPSSPRSPAAGIGGSAAAQAGVWVVRAGVARPLLSGRDRRAGAASVTRYECQRVGCPPVAAQPCDALPLAEWLISAFSSRVEGRTPCAMVACWPPPPAIARRAEGDVPLSAAAGRRNHSTDGLANGAELVSFPELRFLRTAPAVRFLANFYPSRRASARSPTLLLTECFVSSFVGNKPTGDFWLKQAKK